MGFEDVEFRLVAGATVRGSDLRVLGAHVHSYRTAATDCFAICAAASDCAAFVDFRQERLCQFKRSGGKVARTPDAEIDLFLRRPPAPPSLPPLSPPLPPSPPPSWPPAFQLEPLVDDSNHGHRIFAVQQFVSLSEAKALRKFAAACFQRGAAATNEPEHVWVGSAPAAPTKVER